MRRSTIHRLSGLLISRNPALPINRAYKNSKIYEKEYSGFPNVAVDQQCIPEELVWSVHDLMSSYPRPRLSSDKLDQLYDLSALIPPAKGTEERAILTEELEELMRLVEAVKFVDCDALSKAEEQLDDGPVPDGRVPSVLEGSELTSNTREVEFDDPESSGRALLKHAAKTKDAFYIVEQERKYRR